MNREHSVNDRSHGKHLRRKTGRAGLERGSGSSAAGERFRTGFRCGLGAFAEIGLGERLLPTAPGLGGVLSSLRFLRQQVVFLIVDFHQQQEARDQQRAEDNAPEPE